MLHFAINAKNSTNIALKNFFDQRSFGSLNFCFSFKCSISHGNVSEFLSFLLRVLYYTLFSHQRLRSWGKLSYRVVT